MVKELFSFIFLIFFTTSVNAEEIIKKCKFKKYKYIIQDLGNIILSTKKKAKPKWVGRYPGKKTEDNKDWFVSAKKLNFNRISAIEYGVAKGRGLLILEEYAKEIKKLHYQC